MVDVVLDLDDQRDLCSLVERMSNLLKVVKDPWIFWSTELHFKPSIASVALPNESAECAVLIYGQQKATGVAWMDYFIQKMGIPCIWRTTALRAWFASLRAVPPDLRYLPYQIALELAADHLPTLRVAQISLKPFIARNVFQPSAQTLRYILWNTQSIPECTQRQFPPHVSVVICAFNEAARIGWAIRSVLLQTFHAWELLVIDDGSTDQTEQMVRSYNDERICLIKFMENKGKSHALNCALDHVKGHFFLELDADDWLVPDALATLYKASSDLQPMKLLSAHYHVWQSVTKGQLQYRGIHGQNPVLISPEFARVPIPRFYRTSDLQRIGGWMTTDRFAGRLFEDVYMSDQYVKKGFIQILEKPLYHRVIHRKSVSQVHAKDYRAWWQSFKDGET